MQNFDEMMSSLDGKFVKVIIPDETMEKIEKLSDEIICCKMKEKEHKIDNTNEKTRWMTGLVGEAACEIYYGLKIIEWSAGETLKYKHPDIQGLCIGDVGIKTVEKGKFPIIYKENPYPQLFCIRTKYNEVLICGLATKSILNRYQNDDLIIDPNLRKKGCKTGFYGFNYLFSPDILKKNICLVS